MNIIVVGFEIHLLAGALVSLFFQKNTLAALALLAGSVFPDIDSRKSYIHRIVVFMLAVFSLIALNKYGLWASIIGTLIIVGIFKLFLPKHRGWLHKIQGNLVFGLFCLIITLDPVAAVAGIIGTIIHRLLDWI